MASPAAILSVLVKADGIARTNSQLQSLHGDLGKSSQAAARMGDNLEKSSKKGSRALGALKSGAGLAAGAIGVVGLAGAVKSAVGEYQEAVKVGANTNQVIKSTGGVANVSAKHVANLASSISKKVGIDDEAIQSGSNLLLTFKNIRNETGKGRDIFDQATKAAVDLSAAGFGDLSATSKQLGKALNDPVKGMTALGRSGVTFSEQQKTAIAALLATGKAADRVKAQQIILREVQSQVGGQAAAQATTMDKLKVTLGNLAEAAGAVLVPALDKIGKFLIVVINQMIEGKGVGGAIISTFKGVGLAIGDVIAVGAGLISFFKQNMTITLALAAAIGVMATAYVASLVPALIATTAGVMAQVAAWIALRVAFLASPIGLIVTGLTLLAAAVVVAWRESETFRKIVLGAWAVIKAVAGWLITAGVAAFNALSSAVTVAWGIVKSVTNTVWNGIKAFLLPLWNLFKTLITSYFGAYKTIIVGVWNGIKAATSTVWGAIKTVATTAWSGLKAIAKPIWDGIKFVILTPIRLARDGIAAIWGVIKSVAKSAWDGIKTAISKYGQPILDVILWPFKQAAKQVAKFAKLILTVIEKIPGVGNKKIDAAKNSIDKLVEGFASGGVVQRGGVVNRPLVMMGEEAPRHPEFVIPTNPAYRGRARGLMAQAANAIGFAQGGVFNVAEMADLWRSKGGSASLADTMGVIGFVESGGIPTARNPSGATGLWQILGQLVPGDLTNPGINALNAIAKYKAQGLRAWDASKSKWEPLLGKAVGPNLNPLDLIKKLPGVGDLPEWLKGTGKYVLSQVGDWIKDKVASVIPGGGGTSAGGAKGLVPQVLRALAFAGSHGWRGIVTSGFRTHAEQAALYARYLAGGNIAAKPGTSSHEVGQAVDVTDVAGFARAMAMAPPGSKLRNLVPGDALHFSVTGHKMGGIIGQGAPFVGSYRDGGRVPADGYGYLHQGETVVPRGGGGVTVNIAHAEFGSQIDVNSFAATLGFKVATA